MADGLKFNVDGSARGKPGPAGIGGVLRISDGKILCLFSTYVGIKDSNTAEILALHRACDLCSSNASLKGRDVVFASDSKTEVSWVNNTSSIGSFKHVNLIYEIRSFLYYSGTLVVVHNHRSTHSLADVLAKAGSNSCGNRTEWG